MAGLIAPVARLIEEFSKLPGVGTKTAQRLTARGYEARVVGDSRPFRVRVGRYRTRDRATEVVRELSRVNVRGFVVEAERP